MAKPRLLIVEDDLDISNMLRIYFGAQGYDVETAYRGGDALEKTRSGNAASDCSGYHAAGY